MSRFNVLIVLIVCSQALGLTYMGPPTTIVREGDFGIGFDYSQAETDIRIEGTSSVLPDIETDAYLARLILGVADGVELAARIGMADIDDGGNDFAWGASMKLSSGAPRGFDLGTLFQFTATKSEESGYVGPIWVTAELEIYEFQIAVGPSFREDGLCIYGGPFVHFITGNVDGGIGALPYSFDLEQESEFGGYIGMSFELAKNSDLAIEYQVTGDAYAIGIGLMNRFGKEPAPQVPKRPEAPEVDASGRKLRGYRGRRNENTGEIETYPVYEDEK